MTTSEPRACGNCRHYDATTDEGVCRHARILEIARDGLYVSVTGSCTLHEPADGDATRQS